MIDLRGLRSSVHGHEEAGEEADQQKPGRHAITNDSPKPVTVGEELPWKALTGELWALAERQANDDVLGEAMATVSDHPAVQEALAHTIAALERLLAAARDEGGVRADATTLDLRLLFAATRAASELEPGAWRRMLELGIDALQHPAPPATSRR